MVVALAAFTGGAAAQLREPCMETYNAEVVAIERDAKARQNVGTDAAKSVLRAAPRRSSRPRPGGRRRARRRPRHRLTRSRRPQRRRPRQPTIARTRPARTRPRSSGASAARRSIRRSRTCGAKRKSGCRPSSTSAAGAPADSRSCLALAGNPALLAQRSPSSLLNEVPLRRTTRPSLVMSISSPTRKVLASMSTLWKPLASISTSRR